MRPGLTSRHSALVGGVWPGHLEVPGRSHMMLIWSYGCKVLIKMQTIHHSGADSVALNHSKSNLNHSKSKAVVTLRPPKKCFRKEDLSSWLDKEDRLNKEVPRILSGEKQSRL